MTRRPGYDIYGQPTKVDPRDFPATFDPRDACPTCQLPYCANPTHRDPYDQRNWVKSDPLTVEPDEPQGLAPGFRGCAWYTIALLCTLVLAALIAAPRPAVDIGAPRLTGASLVVAEPASASRAAGDYLAGPSSGGAPPLAPAVSYSGIIGYADPSLGRFYLAIPDGRGVRVEICGPAACLIRTSTDAGPDLAMQRTGRIADLNSVDWETISGMPLRYGLTQGTILILARPPRIALPATDTTEEPR